MSAEVSFDKELLDVEQFLLKNLPLDEHLLSMHDATSVIEEEGGADVEHQVTLAPLPKGLSRSTIFQTPEAHPLVLNLLMLDAYGDAWLDWDMPVVEHAVEDKFGPILDVNVSKLMAVQACYKSESPWKNWEALVPVVMAFNNTLPDFETMQVPLPRGADDRRRDDEHPRAATGRLVGGGPCLHGRGLQVRPGGLLP